MSKIIQLRGSGHGDIERALPWYVNGTLAPLERAEIDAHLARCAECRAKLAEETALAGEVANLPLEVDRSWAAMQRRLDEREEPRPAYRLVRMPFGWAIASPLIAASLAAVIVTGAFALRSPEKVYVGLSSGSIERPANIILQVRPETTESRLRLLLDQSGARIVGGPTDSGSYLLNVATPAVTDSTRRLQQAPEVTLAQPIGSVQP
ncbi:MAG: zf-HC2 domain-containing protein [Novosphingobium sp.]|nr:zf-HC2 domain-containing protein [Novosphingobium sp.]